MARKKVEDGIRLQAYISKEQAEQVLSTAKSQKISVCELMRRALTVYFLPKNLSDNSESKSETIAS